jgi:prepilin-type N-terminal cleavage/methylation domain-containing protein
MIYIHRMQNPLSSNLAVTALFRFRSPLMRNMMHLLSPISMTKSSPRPVHRAFTLIELLVVIAILGILVAIATPVFNNVLERAKVTKDLSNLRQIGAATQMYMNDNNGVFPGSGTLTWMSQLEQNQKYLSAWRVLQSPFDRRLPSEAGTGSPVSQISYGINPNVYVSGVAISADKITKPVAFIVFSPAQDVGNTVTFNTNATATAAAPGVTENAGTSSPGGAASGGTSNSRTKITALCADWHAETMPWTGTGPAFTHTDTAGGTDPDGPNRWSP